MWPLSFVWTGSTKYTLRSCKAHLWLLYAEKYVYAMYKQASTNVINLTFQPRWKPKQALPKAICSVDMCDETAYRNTNMASREQIENLVGQKLVTFAI